MIHLDKDAFVKTLQRVSVQTGFLPTLVEKDYYLTLLLSNACELSENLVFKGGTCLSKVFFSQYRLSEDLDFSMLLPQYEPTRGQRRECIRPVKENIADFCGQFGMRMDETSVPGRNESRQYVYNILYRSVLRDVESRIKLEIGLRFNPIEAVKIHPVNHAFNHPFTGEPLFDGGRVVCLSLDELIAEKLRAAALRKTIAPRDFYDVDFILRSGCDLKRVLGLFKKKLLEDKAPSDISKYRENLGRLEGEITDMSFRIETELLDVLSPSERQGFDLGKALKRINRAMNAAL